MKASLFAILSKWHSLARDEAFYRRPGPIRGGRRHFASRRFVLKLCPIRIGLLTLIIALVPGVASSQEQVLEVIQLSNRQAEEVVELIRPFLGFRGTAVASGTKLIVKTSPENMTEILRLIEQLDQRLAQFRISVLQSSQRSLAELNAAARVSGNISSRGAGVRARGHLYQTEGKHDGEITQQIRTTEGRAAHIQVGKAFPVPAYAVSGYDGIPYPSAGITYHEATSGFAVVPRLAGNDVLLEVSPWSDRLSRLGGGVVHTQSAHTTIRAPLGEWVNFGGQDDSESAQGSGILSRYEHLRKNAINVYIKVDRIR